MMMPKFVDVIEFVKDGQSDPEMEETLGLHPDGQELLKQARFICKMLDNEADDKAAVGDELASFDMDAAGPTEVAAMQLEALSGIAEESGSFFEAAARMESPEYSSSISRMVENIGRDGEDLGTLVFEDDGQQSLFAYEPSSFANTKLNDPKLISSLQLQVGTKNIRILGNNISIFVPNSVPAGERLSVRIAFGLRETPAYGFPFLYMPESGPFLELEADDNGVIELQMSDLPGTIRFDKPTPQFLHIQAKK
jgi:hypothetical protein